jgi:alkanesulfonate monooxygenase
MTAARATGALAVRYPQPAAQETVLSADESEGAIRIGIIARPTAEEAWAVALERFPDDRKGEIMQMVASSKTDSQWRRNLAELSAGADPNSRDPYWLQPFRTHASFCPYLVGSYQRVARELAQYITKRIYTYILDAPRSADELPHVMTAVRLACEITDHD